MTDLDEIILRLDRVEKQHRRIKQVGVTVLLSVSLIGLMAQAAPPNRSVEAQKFLLRDPKGNQVGSLFADGKGAHLILSTSGKEERPLLSLCANSSGVAISLDGPKTEQVFTVIQGDCTTEEGERRVNELLKKYPPPAKK